MEIDAKNLKSLKDQLKSLSSSLSSFLKQSDTEDDIIELTPAMSSLCSNTGKALSMLSDMLVHSANRAAQRTKSWKDMQEQMKAEADKASKKITFDVGGRTFSTTKETLLQRKDTYFSAMLTTKKWKPDANGNYFIDRNPAYFEVILNYLRSGTIPEEYLTGGKWEDMMIELDYFRLPHPPKPILKSNTERSTSTTSTALPTKPILKSTTPTPGETQSAGSFSPTLVSPKFAAMTTPHEGMTPNEDVKSPTSDAADRADDLENSKILSLTQLNTINQWLKEGKKRKKMGKLLYRASVHGFMPADFHAQCDGKGPTIVVVRSKKPQGCIFGGFAAEDWGKGCGWTTSKGHFLFSLINPNKNPPMMYPCSTKGVAAQLCDVNHMPVFGEASDLYIGIQSNEQNTSHTDFDGYINKTGHEFPLTGSRQFLIEDIEIVQVDEKK